MDKISCLLIKKSPFLFEKGTLLKKFKNHFTNSKKKKKTLLKEAEIYSIKVK